MYEKTEDKRRSVLMAMPELIVLSHQGCTTHQYFAKNFRIENKEDCDCSQNSQKMARITVL